MSTFLSAIISTVLPLAVKNQDALFRVFRIIRRNAMSNASSIVSLVMGVACLIIVIKLIKLTYDMESDEQAAGFGGVTLWQICRPVVVLFALTIYPTLLGTIDGVADTLTTGIIKTADNQNTRAKVAALIDVVEAEADENVTQEEAQEKMQSGVQVLNSNGQNSGAFMWTPANDQKVQDGTLTKRDIKAEVEEVTNRKMEEMTETEMNAKEVRQFKRNLRRAISAYYRAGKVEKADGFKLTLPVTWLPGLCKMIYDWAFLIIECGAEIILCVLCFAGPVVLTISLIDQYKHSFMEFIMRYFQFSFWKVAAAIINWAVESAQSGTVDITKTLAREDVGTVIATASEGAKYAGQASTALWVIAWIALAGIFCFTKIGDLAAYFIPVNGGGMASGAGAAVAAGAGAAAGAATGARTIAGGISSIASHRAGKAQGKQMESIASGVNAISQSMEGSKVSKGE